MRRRHKAPRKPPRKKKMRRPPPLEKRPTQPLTAAESDRLLRCIPRRSLSGRRNYALVVFMLQTGVRCAEALALLPKDLDREAGQADIQHGKGDKQRRVHVPATAFAIVDGWLEFRRTALEIGDDAPLFCTMDGKALDDRNVRRLMARLGKRAQLGKRCHPHGLRATMAQRMLLDGRDILEIQAQLGHEHVGTTLGYLRDIAGSAALRRLKGYDPLEGKAVA